MYRKKNISIFYYFFQYKPQKEKVSSNESTDPPLLESGAEEKDQYKAYGKTFRKMISDCLQKGTYLIFF